MTNPSDGHGEVRLAPTVPSMADRMPPRLRRRDAAIVLVAGLVLFALNVDFTLYGDAPLYADYSLRRHFTEVTLHIGFYWIVVAAQATIGNLLRVPIQETMVWVNVVAGAFSLAVGYLLALELLGSRRDALLTVTIFALSGRLIGNATSSEMYVVQTAFVLLSFLLFVRQHTVGAGLAAAAGLLVSPLSAFAYLFFPVYDYQRSGVIRWRVLLVLAATAAIAYLPYLVFYGHDLLWGPRGLLVVRGLTPLEPGQLLANFPRYQFKQFTALSLLLAPALLQVRKQARLTMLAAAVALPHLYIIIKLTGEDNVFILNTDFFFSVILVLGWRELSANRALKWAGPALLACHIGILVLSRSIFTFQMHRGHAAEMHDIASTYLVGKNATIITGWGTGMSLVFYGRPTPVTTLQEEPLFQQIYDIDKPYLMRLDALNAHELYVLDLWDPSPLNRFFSSPESVRQQYRQHSVRFIAERQLHLTCTLRRQAQARLYECVRNTAGPPS